MHLPRARQLPPLITDPELFHPAGFPNQNGEIGHEGSIPPVPSHIFPMLPVARMFCAGSGWPKRGKADFPGKIARARRGAKIQRGGFPKGVSGSGDDGDVPDWKILIKSRRHLFRPISGHNGRFSFRLWKMQFPGFAACEAKEVWRR